MVVPKQELGNQPFMGLRPTQDHETGGTGFPSCAWTPEGGCPTLSDQKKVFRRAHPTHHEFMAMAGTEARPTIVSYPHKLPGLRFPRTGTCWAIS